ncbi:exopolysaccharide biosynthesis protein [Desulfonatronum thioautotrophicum]|uniref:exopolysaccharide biosynthesis protein n=1 Tax=Desulfonatronum thioautotrophicum TaxID=617001 RepID=UPI0005EBBDC4|nr:exopolysaccharide biosynthesis protein [Desulfonatronum thioautotrophicum]
MDQEPVNLEQLLDRIDTAACSLERVSVETILEAVGSRSFGPLLLLAGLILVSPLSGIPGTATSMAVIVLLCAVQLVLGRSHFWLPSWLLQRSVPHNKLKRALVFVRPHARAIDGWLRPRLTFLVHRTGTYFIALACIVIALGLPAMELVPFSASSAGGALTVFGLALVFRDGLLALLAFAIAVATSGLVVSRFL